jgi:hypothetical protein
VLWTAIPAAVAAWFGGPRPVADRLPGLIDDDLDADDEEPATGEHAAGEPDEHQGDDPGDADGDADGDTYGDTDDEPGEDLDEETGEGTEEAPEPDRESGTAELPGPRDAVEESGEVARE